MALRLIRRHLKDCRTPPRSTAAASARSTCTGRWPARGSAGRSTRHPGTPPRTHHGWTASGEIGVVKAEAPTVREAIRKFLADCEARIWAGRPCGSTATCSRIVCLRWCRRKGLHNLQHLSVDGLRQFRQSWKDSPLYATKNLERTRAFLVLPSGRLDQGEPGHGGEASEGDPDPDAAVLSRRDEADRLGLRQLRREQGRINAFVLTMRYTGLRIGDAIRLSRARWLTASLRPHRKDRATGDGSCSSRSGRGRSAKSRMALTGTSGPARASAPPSPTGRDISAGSSNLPISRAGIPTDFAIHAPSNFYWQAHPSRTWRTSLGTLHRWWPSITRLGCGSVRSGSRNSCDRAGADAPLQEGSCVQYGNWGATHRFAGILGPEQFVRSWFAYPISSSKHVHFIAVLHRILDEPARQPTAEFSKSGKCACLAGT